MRPIGPIRASVSTRTPDSFSYELTLDGGHWRGISLDAARRTATITEPEQPGERYGSHLYCVKISVQDEQLHVEQLRAIDLSVHERVVTLRDGRGRPRAQLWVEGAQLAVTCLDELGAEVKPVATFLP